MRRGLLNAVKCVAAMLVVATVANCYEGAEVKAADFAAPTETATRENVLAIVQNYDSEAYYILTEESAVGNDFFSRWYFPGGKVLQYMDTAVHETYHGYTFDQAYKYGSGWVDEVIYAGSGVNYYICIDDIYNELVRTEVMAKDIPENLRTFRYGEYVAPGADPTANTQAMAGLINEFTAYYWGMETMSSMVPYLITYDSDGTGFADYVVSLANNMTAYEEFKFWMLRYMMFLRENYPSQYNAWLANKGFCNAYADMEVKFNSLISNNVSAIPKINQIIKSRNYEISYSSDGLFLKKYQNGGWTGKGLQLGDYNVLAAELSKPEYVEMDSILKGGASNSLNGIVQGEDGNWYLYVNGEIDYTYTGLYCDKDSKWWMVKYGQVDFDYDDLYNDETIGWWKVKNGTIDFEYTGLYNSEAMGWWKIQGGTIDSAYNDLYYDSVMGWWKIVNGQIDFAYSGLYCSPSMGWWLIKGGMLDWTYNDIYNDANLGLWKIQGGTIDFAYTELYCSPTYGWYKIYGGMVDTGYNDLYCSPVFGWWKIKDGMIDFDYVDLYLSPSMGWWMISYGALAFDYNDVFFSPLLNGYLKIAGGTIDWYYTDLYMSSFGWWKVKGGILDLDFNGIYDSPTMGMWLITWGGINFYYDGVYEDSVYGAWYCKGGTIDYSFTGRVITNGISYDVVNGQATRATLGAAPELDIIEPLAELEPVAAE